MSGPSKDIPDEVFAAGWLDAYARRPAKQGQPERYRNGYAAGQKNRERTDRKLPHLKGVQPS